MSKVVELDLRQSIRPGLDILANEIVIALRKRVRFARNPAVYLPGLVRGDPALSLLDYELAKVEQAHAELGRYTFANQESFTPVDEVAPIIEREVPPSPIEPMYSAVGPSILRFYQAWIDQFCRAGTEPDTYGETVTADVASLLGVMERVNLGKYVAESKFQDDPDAYCATGGERDGLIALLRHPDREAEVLELARGLAEHYDLIPDGAVRVFEFMIEVTIDIEIDYLRMRIGQHPARSAT